MRYTATSADDGKTVKELIAELLHPSAKLLKALKYRPDGILLSGCRVTVRATVHAGDVLTLAMDDASYTGGAEPVDLPIEILYEDDDLVVPAKPGNMPTHPSHDHYLDTVANALAYRYRNAGAPFVFRPINRLDRETSGLLLVARNRLAAGRLTESMQRGEIRKTYLAVLCGDTLPDRGGIDLPLHRSAASIIVREICSPDAPDADPSRTRYRVLARRGGYSLVEAVPLTGRTHQLRVHFASQGCPIVGDTLYGIADKRIGRQALHAHTLSFPHPVSGSRLSFTAPLPSDMACLIAELFPESRIGTEAPEHFLETFRKGEPT